MCWLLVRARFGPTLGQWDHVVDSIGAGMSTDVADVGRCDDRLVDALSRASVDPLVILAHSAPIPSRCMARSLSSSASADGHPHDVSGTQHSRHHGRGPGGIQSGCSACVSSFSKRSCGSVIVVRPRPSMRSYWLVRRSSRVCWRGHMMRRRGRWGVRMGQRRSQVIGRPRRIEPSARRRSTGRATRPSAPP